MPVGRKLFVAFAMVLAAIAVMGVVVVSSLAALNAAGKARGQENEINRTAATAEFYLARQENAYRGYLLSRDGYYLDRVNQHRAKFLEAMQKLRSDLPTEREAPVDKALQANAEWYKNVVEAGQALVAEGKVAEAASMVGRQGVADTYMGPSEDAIDELQEINLAALAASKTAQDKAARDSMIAVIAGLIAAFAIALGSGFAVTRAIVRPIFAMIG